jgi:hypothetical protein
MLFTGTDSISPILFKITNPNGLSSQKNHAFKSSVTLLGSYLEGTVGNGT